jgi:hypothetical protein
VAVQLFGERDEVDGLLGFAERDHLQENAAVLIEKEIFGAQILDGGVERVIVEQDGAEDGAFGVKIIGQWAFESGFDRHADSAVLRFLFAQVNTPSERGSSV